MYKRNILARSRNHCGSGKGITITYSECVSVALLSSAARLVIPHFFFPHYLINGKIFLKKKEESY
jgi:hypothetical protein